MPFVPATFRVDAQLSVGVWTSLLADLARADPFTWRRGLQAGGPLDLVAVSGQCAFSLRNDAGNSAHTLGYYSPNHPSCRAGFARGIPMRVAVTYSAVEYVLWTGKLWTIDPQPGSHGERRTRCVAYDCMWDLAENDARGVTPQLNQTENQLVAAVLAALPASAQPVGASYDGTLDTYPYALDNANGQTTALALITDIANSARAFVYPLADGTLHVENRQARSLMASSFAFRDADCDELAEPGGIDTIWNHVRVTIHPRTIDAAATTVLYGITDRVAVGPGETLTLFGDYHDPANALDIVGGTAQVTPIVSGTDYKANSVEAGGGTDKTSAVSVVATAFAASVKFEVTNGDSSTVYMVDASGNPLLQIRGKGIYNKTPIDVEATSVEDFERLLELDLPYQQDANVAQDLATTVQQQYVSLANQILSVGFVASRRADLMAQALTGEIGDVVTVSEAVTGLANVEAVINAIDMEVSPAGILHCRYITAPIRGGGHPFVLDDGTYGLLDSAVGTLGYL